MHSTRLPVKWRLALRAWGESSGTECVRGGTGWTRTRAGKASVAASSMVVALRDRATHALTFRLSGQVTDATAVAGSRHSSVNRVHGMVVAHVHDLLILAAADGDRCRRVRERDHADSSRLLHEPVLMRASSPPPPTHLPTGTAGRDGSCAAWADSGVRAAHRGGASAWRWRQPSSRPRP